MTKSRPFYGHDLAYIHDVGFSGFAAGCAPGLLEIPLLEKRVGFIARKP